MYERTTKFAREFPKKYKALRELPSGGLFGALIVKVEASPPLIFEILDVVFGPYTDLLKNFKHIDDKSTWSWLFVTDAGILNVYDYKGGTSIGYASNLNKDLEKEAFEFKKALENAALIYPQIRRDDLKDEIKEDPILNFLRTFLATYNLLVKAQENGCLLEALVLYASTIDAHLRYGIILARQIRVKTPEYDKQLVYQSGPTFISEREIHKLAFDELFISRDQYVELSTLYDFRNRAVHRYFISDFEYKELPAYLDRFEVMRKSVLDKIVQLEHKQVKEGVGMITPDDIKNDEFSRRISISQEHLKIDSDSNVVAVPKRKHIFPREHGPREDTKEVD